LNLWLKKLQMNVHATLKKGKKVTHIHFVCCLRSNCLIKKKLVECKKLDIKFKQGSRASIEYPVNIPTYWFQILRFKAGYPPLNLKKSNLFLSLLCILMARIKAQAAISEGLKFKNFGSRSYWMQIAKVMSKTDLILSTFRILMNLSTNWMGPGKLKSKPSLTIICASKSIRTFLLTCFYSSSVKSWIILAKLGEIGCSSFADIRTEMVASETSCEFRMFWGPVYWT